MSRMLFIMESKNSSLHADKPAPVMVKDGPGVLVVVQGNGVSGFLALHHERIYAGNAAMQQAERKVNSGARCDGRRVAWMEPFG
ncbi:SH2 domain-containing protein [Azospirillum canadense]|uniref:hypothetical protein n=1 Tax=Azospirillum canadense TaxID=403962 RepID=UPI002227BF65|nr:hypothetical protein [Azospirillum canadense]MCW2239318.1 hypothetical protein [Azospirillum canadense]